MIELRGISKRFLDNVVLDGVDFEVQDGETVALLGPSGVGKSVLLKHVIGLIKPDKGDVIVDGLSVPHLKRKELSDGFCSDRVKECLRLVNLAPEVGHKYPAELSGGMRKRVGIARAIAGQPKYLLYDEPTSGLDPVNADVIDGLIERLQSELGVTSVVVSHDVRGSFRVADRVALLWQAKIRAVGKPEEILASRDPAVQQFLERDLEMALIQSEADQGEAERGERHGA